jgi:uncharacterized membrane protein YgcG
MAEHAEMASSYAVAEEKPMTPTWLATWTVDNPMLFSIIVLCILAVTVVILHLTFQQRWATAAAAILIPFAMTVVLNHVLAESRDREGRRWTLRQEHVRRLKTVLQAEAEKLSEVAERTETHGAPLLSQDHNPGSRRNEMEVRFSPDPLSDDVENHYAAYWQKKNSLRNAVEVQDREYAELVSRLVKMLNLAHENPYRLTVARAFVSKCLGLGPGMTLTSDDKAHSYSWLGGGTRAGGGGGGPAPVQMIEAFRAFTALQSVGPRVRTYCATLKTRAATIVDTATTLSADARRLAEQTLISGDCQYTRLD